MTDIFGTENIPILLGFIVFALYAIYAVVINVIWWKEDRKHNGSKK